MISIAIKSFIIDIGLNLMFDNIIQNFANPVKVSVGHSDPEYLIVGEPLALYMRNDEIILCSFNACMDGYMFVTLDNGERLKYATSEILCFDRIDYDDSAYDADGWIDIDDDERITDEKLIEWLKQKEKES